MIHQATIAERQNWMAVLAKAEWSELEALWSRFSDHLKCQMLRKPETGLVMVRGRMGGSGQSFNTGEATVTRCSVRHEHGETGHAYVLGRNHKHALAAAELDAGLQNDELHDVLIEQVIEPLNQHREQKLELHRRKVAATKVDFFTMVRGEDD